jgi:hypothetical protein
LIMFPLNHRSKATNSKEETRWILPLTPKEASQKP